MPRRSPRHNDFQVLKEAYFARALNFLLLPFWRQNFDRAVQDVVACCNQTFLGMVADADYLTYV
jgi:hypothetical protein